MNFPSARDTWESEIDAFISTLKEVFDGEEWGEIRHYAEKAWDQCGLADGKTWASIEDRVRAEWSKADK